MTDIEEVLARLNPKIRKKVMMANSVVIEKQRLPLESLNRALGGGLAYGRQVLVYGNKSAGKSSLCLQLIGEAQKQGKVCAWIDAEKSYDPEWAAKLGVNSDELIYVPANTINHVVEASVDLMKSGVDIVVVDSISASLGGVFFEKDGDLKDLENTGQIGADAKAWGAAVKMMNYANDNTLLILISQMRSNINTTYVENIPTGGKAVMFYSSTILRLTSSKSRAIHEKVEVNGRMTQRNVGREVTWLVEFNKLAEPDKTGTYNFYFDGPSIGLDKMGDLVRVGLDEGIIERAGSWFTIFDERVQGEAAVVEAIKSDPLLEQKLREAIDG